MAHDDNPAGRLYEILKAVSTGPKTGMVSAWAEVFDLDATDLPSILEAVASVMRLPAEIRSRFAMIAAADAELVLRHLPDVEQLLQRAMNGTRDSFSNALAEHHFYGLEVASSRLSAASRERVVGDEALEGLLAEVEGLSREVAEAGVDPELRDILLAHLHSMQSSLRLYRATGARGVREAALRFVGEAALQGKTWANEPSSVKKLLQRVWDVAYGAIQLTSAVSGTLALPASIDAMQKALGS